MVTLAPYDQRFVRRDGQVYRTTASAHPLCNSCGDEPRCNIRRGMQFQAGAFGVEAPVVACGVFVPVLTFKDDSGLNSTFNTFRRGAGWFNRSREGAKIRLFSHAVEDFVGDGVVIERRLGKLEGLLERHAAMNHLLRDGNYPDADARLLRVLQSLYGRNYASPDEEYSVIYVEVN